MTIEDDRRRLVTQLRAEGIVDARVLAAMESVRRDAFVPADIRRHAYENVALPIGAGQTISQPTIVALMAEAARLRPTDRVLEIGTGSGYGAAVLASLAGRVVSVERLDALADGARERLSAEGFGSVRVVVGDGTLGWPAGAPYDAIVVTAGGPDIPDPLIDQLAPGGRLIIPVGPKPSRLDLVRLTRAADGSLARDSLGPVAFVPLVGAHGWAETPPEA